MRQLLTVLVLAVLCGLSTARADSALSLKSGDFTIQIDAREQANLIYQLDCQAQLITCTTEVFERLWREDFSFNREDREFLNKWAETRRELQKRGSSKDPTLPIQAVVPILRSDDETTWTKIRWVEFGAADAEELQRAWVPLLPGETVTQLKSVMDHFRPRFAAWWTRHESETANFIPGEVEQAAHARVAHRRAYDS